MTLQLVPPSSGARAALPAGRPAAGAVTGSPALTPGEPPGGPPGGLTGGLTDGLTGELSEELPEEPDPPAEPPADPLRELTERLAERTADLWRVKAEYDNYRHRVRRDRLAVREIAVANVLTRLLPVLDALDAARGQGRLDGGLAAVAEVLETELAGLGLRAFGDPGEPFDPTRHTAVTGGPAVGPAAGGLAATPVAGGLAATPAAGGPAVTPVVGGSAAMPVAGGLAVTPAVGGSAVTPGSRPVSILVCAEVVRRGYQVGEQMLRPAEVVVSEVGDQ